MFSIHTPTRFTQCAQGHVCPCPLWRLGAPPCHPHLPTPLSVNDLLCYRKQWGTDNMTNNACVTHLPLDRGNNRWRENKRRSFWFMYLGLTHAGIYLMVTWHMFCCSLDANSVFFFCLFQSNLNSFFCDYDSREDSSNSWDNSSLKSDVLAALKASNLKWT